MEYTIKDRTGRAQRTANLHHSLQGNQGLIVYQAGMTYYGVIASPYAYRERLQHFLGEADSLVGISGVNAGFANAILDDIQRIKSGQQGRIISDGKVLSALESIVRDGTPFVAANARRDEPLRKKEERA